MSILGRDISNKSGKIIVNEGKYKQIGKNQEGSKQIRKNHNKEGEIDKNQEKSETNRKKIGENQEKS